MRSGIMYGAAATMDGMIERIEEELGRPVNHVLATGGRPGRSSWMPGSCAARLDRASAETRMPGMITPPM